MYLVTSAQKANNIQPEFHNFEEMRSPKKFQVGQFWDIYDDDDGMPRYYCQIKKIDHIPNLALHVYWIYGCSPPKGIIHCHDKEMPIGCGIFELQNTNLHEMTTDSFSHQVGPEPTGKKDEHKIFHKRGDKKGTYKIFPKNGEVWAVYKYWSAQLKFDKLENYEHEIVEMIH